MTITIHPNPPSGGITKIEENNENFFLSFDDF